jgi:ABC-type amino acid transport system permease subunit
MFVFKKYDRENHVFLEKESSILIEWFNFNCMQANPDKFQTIAVGKKTYTKEPVFNIESTNIKFFICAIVICILSSFIMFAFEQKCQAKGQKLKLDNIKE